MLLEYGSVPGSLFCCIDNSLTTGFMRVCDNAAIYFGVETIELLSGEYETYMVMYET